MKRELSCGAVIYKVDNDKIYYLVEYMKQKHISLVKGHIEENETFEECALREILEEASLKVSLDTSFKNVITYAPYQDNPEILKDVIFFVAKVDDNSIIPIDNHDDEVEKLSFYEFYDAYNLLTYPSDKETLFKANEFIKRKENL